MRDIEHPTCQGHGQASLDQRADDRWANSLLGVQGQLVGVGVGVRVKVKVVVVQEQSMHNL
jgi:hypothetical protein